VPPRSLWRTRGPVNLGGSLWPLADLIDAMADFRFAGDGRHYRQSRDCFRQSLSVGRGGEDRGCTVASTVQQASCRTPLRLCTNEKWTFLVRPSRCGQRRSSKILIFLVGPAEVPPFNKINHLILSRRHNGPQMGQRFLTDCLANPGDCLSATGRRARSSMEVGVPINLQRCDVKVGSPVRWRCPLGVL
jgi:hypothetical protein